MLRTVSQFRLATYPVLFLPLMAAAATPQPAKARVQSRCHQAWVRLVVLVCLFITVRLYETVIKSGRVEKLELAVVLVTRPVEKFFRLCFKFLEAVYIKFLIANATEIFNTGSVPASTAFRSLAEYGFPSNVASSNVSKLRLYTSMN